MKDVVTPDLTPHRGAHTQARGYGYKKDRQRIAGTDGAQGHRADLRSSNPSVCKVVGLLKEHTHQHGYGVEDEGREDRASS